MAVLLRELHKLESTRGPIEILVDPASIPHWDPYTWTRLATQEDVDTALANGGASAFQSLQRAWEALPHIIQHDVTINLAAGEHLPVGDNILVGWLLSNKMILGRGNITITGPLPSDWPLVDPTLDGLIIDTYDDGASTLDPYVDCSLSNPGVFSGMDLKGRFVLLETGQLHVIVRHTDDRLYVSKGVWPAPTEGVATMKVITPAVVFKNTLDGEYPMFTAEDLSITVTAATNDDTEEYEGAGILRLQNFAVEMWGGDAINLHGCHSTFDPNGNGRIQCSQLYMYPSEYGPYGHGIAGDSGSDIQCNSVSIREPGAEPLYIWGGAYLKLHNCYIRGGWMAARIFNHGGFWMAATVFDTVGSDIALSIVDAFFFGFIGPYWGRHNEIRDAGGTGLYLAQNSNPWGTHNGRSEISECDLLFTNCVGPCVEIGPNQQLDFLHSSNCWKSGGGNLDVGILISGPLSSVLMWSYDLTGAIGDVRMGGDIIAYLDVSGLGPCTDEFHNILQVEAAI